VYARWFLEAAFWGANFFLVFEIYFWKWGGNSRSPSGMTTRNAKAETNTGVLRCAQDDDEKNKGNHNGNG
jgi:hypothetical protein